MSQEAITSQINAIVAKCWADESFKQKLLADSATALKAEGIEIPAGYTVNVLENSSKVINFVLPPNPNAELSDAELESVAGGKGNPGQIFKGIGMTLAGGTMVWTGVGTSFGGQLGAAGIHTIVDGSK